MNAKEMNAEKVVELWDKYGMYDCIREHCIRVSALSVEIAKTLIQKGEKINIGLVKYGGLLHDIAKVYDIEKKSDVPHNIKGKEILLNEGFRKYATICENHFLDSMFSGKKLSRESFIIILADHLTCPDGYTSFKKRFARMEKQYPSFKKLFDDSYVVLLDFFNYVFLNEDEYKNISKDLNKKLDFKNKEYIHIINEL